MIATVMAIMFSLCAGLYVLAPAIFTFFAGAGWDKVASVETCIEIAVILFLHCKGVLGERNGGFGCHFVARVVGGDFDAFRRHSKYILSHRRFLVRQCLRKILVRNQVCSGASQVAKLAV